MSRTFSRFCVSGYTVAPCHRCQCWLPLNECFSAVARQQRVVYNGISTYHARWLPPTQIFLGNFQASLSKKVNCSNTHRGLRTDGTLPKPSSLRVGAPWPVVDPATSTYVAKPNVDQ
ncbi:uncharacterized protein LOC119431172 isoform X2 [Dermacentor silvarum]|uniref:uncharacterized protein LOC119431172 isoform X2 n=1 Tax=Dermacentor silvarum TaxID=543639 RepID=UPI002100CF60|nr:uncharacterized protein LOC119431172 isoform X2 [Dermacentor silvarum]